MSHVSDQEFDRLCQLSHVRFSPEEREVVRGKIDSVIDMLEQLKQVDTTDVQALKHPVSGHIMRLGGEVDMPTDPAAILHNVSHRMINNAVKIKSMIEGE